LLYCYFFLFIFSFMYASYIEIYILSLHDALPILVTGFTQFLKYKRTDPKKFWTPTLIILGSSIIISAVVVYFTNLYSNLMFILIDRKSTRLNSSHVKISYAVFCLKKKKIHHIENF